MFLIRSSTLYKIGDIQKFPKAELVLGPGTLSVFPGECFPFYLKITS